MSQPVRNTDELPAVGTPVERPVRPVAWADDAAAQGCVGNCASAAAKEYWERGHWTDKANAAKLRHPLYAAQTLWNACAQAGAIEREKLEPLLRRSLAQLRKWAEWYGKADHAARGQLPLPPAGNVELAEDISAALGPNAQVVRRGAAGGASERTEG